jgi:hypothetical protein
MTAGRNFASTLGRAWFFLQRVINKADKLLGRPLAACLDVPGVRRNHHAAFLSSTTVGLRHA